MIEIKRLDKKFNKNKENEIHVINDMTLEFPDHGLIALFGKSGCGKTTLLNVLGGLDNADGGEILYDGERASGKNKLISTQIGYIFQNYNLLNTLTVAENVAAGLRITGMTDEAEIANRVRHALSCVQMEKYSRRTPDTLSGGQQQRVAIARAIVKGAHVILADEPTGNLDESNTVMVMDILKQLSRDRLVLLVTHERELVDTYCDHVIELEDGKTVAQYDVDRTEREFVSRHILFLGDKQKTDLSSCGVEIAYYGDQSDGKPSVKIISHEGKIFVQVERARVIMPTSETKIVEQSRKEYYDSMHKEMDLSPFEDHSGVLKKNYGRLFNLRSAIKSGVNTYIRKTKGGRKFLMVILTLISAVMVVASAYLGSIFYDQNALTEGLNEDYCYLRVTEQQTIDDLYSILGTYGIADLKMNYLKSSYDEETWGSSFTTARDDYFTLGLQLGYFNQESQIINTRGLAVNANLAKDRKLLAGKSTVENAGEVILSSACADAILQDGGINTVKTYEDILAMVGATKYSYGTQSGYFHVVGIVEDDQLSLYMNGDYLCYQYFEKYNVYGNIAPVSSLDENKKLNAGEVIVCNKWKGCSAIRVGDVINVKEFTFTVVETIKDSYTFSPYYICEEDYHRISMSYDLARKHFGKKAEFWYGVYSTDIEQTVGALTHFYGEENVITVEDLQTERAAWNSSKYVTAYVVTAVAAVLMSVCLYFIMRSVLLPRIREMGIYRAIGVTKRNLLYRALIETAVLASCTVLVGYLVASALVWSAMSVTAQIFAYLYYPWWMALPTLLVIAAVTFGFGLLPVHSVLKATPAQILAKYDI